MNDTAVLYPFSKVIPVFGPSVFDKYLLTVDFFCPWQLICHEKDEEEDDYSFLKRDCKLAVNSDCDRDKHVCPCFANAVQDSCPKKIKMEMDALLYSIIDCELKRSRSFRRNVLSNFYNLYRESFKGVPENKHYCSMCRRLLWVSDVAVNLRITKKNIIDYKWNKKLEILANERCELENAMAWLSTLGGAFSALGEHFIECAEKAGLISVQQFCLALRLGDPLTICRCKIYLAMSLLQRGYYKKTEMMIRDLHKFSIGPEGSLDFRLKNMCIAVWNRLKYDLSLKKKHTPAHSG